MSSVAHGGCSSITSRLLRAKGARGEVDGEGMTGRGHKTPCHPATHQSLVKPGGKAGTLVAWLFQLSESSSPNSIVQQTQHVGTARQETLYCRHRCQPAPTNSRNELPKGPHPIPCRRAVPCLPIVDSPCQCLGLGSPVTQLHCPSLTLLQVTLQPARCRRAHLHQPHARTTHGSAIPR